MEQGKTKGEGEQHDFVWQGNLWQTSYRSSEVQAYHPVRLVWQIEGTVWTWHFFLYFFMLYVVIIYVMVIKKPLNGIPVVTISISFDI